MPAFQKVCPSCMGNVHVRKSKCPCGHSFSTKPKLILKSENAMKSIERRRNSTAECQAAKEPMKQLKNQRVVSVPMLSVRPVKELMKQLKNQRVESVPMLKVMPVKELMKQLKNQRVESVPMLKVMPVKELMKQLKNHRVENVLMLNVRPIKELIKLFISSKNVNKLV